MRLLLILAAALVACGPQIPLPIIAQPLGAGGGSGLIQSTNLTLVGGFRTPGTSAQDSANFGGHAIVADPTGNSGAGSVILAGWPDTEDGLIPVVAELSVPTLVNSSTVTSLNTATNLSGWVDPSGGNYTTVTAVYGGGGNVSIGGLGICPSTLCGSAELVISYFVNYDASGQVYLSHILSSRSSFTYIGGPYQVGAGDSCGAGSNCIGGAGWTAGQMAPIPSSWQSSLGGKWLTGLCCAAGPTKLSIVARTSQGATASSFDPSQIATSSTANLLLGYDMSHTTIGSWGSNQMGPTYNMGTDMTPVAFPDVAHTVLFGGAFDTRTVCTPNASYPNPPANGCSPLTGGTYGLTTNVSAEDNTQCPGDGDTAHDCYYDPNEARLTGPGNIAYPCQNHMWAYDANDLAAVKAGTKTYYQPVPYADWSVTFPIAGCPTPVDSGITAMAYSATGFSGSGATCPCLFVVQYGVDSTSPLVWVFNVSTPPAPEPLPSPIEFFTKLWGIR